MITKTISGHYDTVFSLNHNNRTFTPKNVDASRSQWNYNCVAAGHQAPLDLENPANLSAFWVSYREIAKLYWEDRAVARKQAYEAYQEHLENMRKFRYAANLLTDNGITAFISLLFLPLLLPLGIFHEYQMKKARAEYEQLKECQWILDIEFRQTKCLFREAVREQDLASGTGYLQLLDSITKEMAAKANDYVALAKPISTEETAPTRFATLEEIYDKLFEPSFQEFQRKQRPCRRYNGTYLESLREGQQKETQKKQQSKNTKMRKTAEAIEIVFGIGDMDNTGYIKAFSEAKQSEMLLKDFCDHLMEDPHLCCVTTKELVNPSWKPPFKNGLIVLNLTVHCDEATPGVHLTCIPYSSGCKRGPSVQAALGRAMTGMGYPSTWTDALDESGLRIPKRDRSGQVIYNEDGTIRYQQKPDKQGIIDWIEEQKLWIQKEMEKRYGWTREYKGSYPRGNLSTPDYKVAKAIERTATLDRAVQDEITNYIARVRSISLELQSDVKGLFEDASVPEMVMHYLKHCPEEDYVRVMNEVHAFWHHFVTQEERKAVKNLTEKIKEVQRKTATQTPRTGHKQKALQAGNPITHK